MRKIFEYMIYNDSYISQSVFLVKEDNNIIGMYISDEFRNIKFLLEEEETRIFEFTVPEYMDIYNMIFIRNKYDRRKIIEKKINKNDFSNNYELEKMEREILLTTNPSYISLEHKIQDILASIR